MILLQDYIRLKWQEMPAMPRMVGLILISLETEVLLGELYPNANVGLISQFVKDHAMNFITIPGSPYGSFDTVSKKTWDNRGWGNIKVKTIGCSRDSKFNLEYFEHLLKYNSIVVDDGINVGLLIWRVESVSTSLQEDYVGESYQYARIVDFLPNSESNAFELLIYSV